MCVLAGPQGILKHRLIAGLGMAPKKAKKRIDDLKAKYALSEIMAQDKKQARTAYSP